MEFIEGIPQLKANGRYRVIALGTFDGVHLGHQKLIRRLVEVAKAKGGESVVLTFEPHPFIEIAPHRIPPLLTTTRQKQYLIEKAGVDIMIAARLSSKLAGLQPEEFVVKVLRQQLAADAVVVGFNYTFGYQGSGNAVTLQQLGHTAGLAVEVVEPVYVDGVIISSSEIRDLLARGMVKQATQMLGRPPFLTGTVISGAKLASELGYPTANLALDNQDLPYANGVYLTRVKANGQNYYGAANIGYKPTFNGKQRMVEVHLLGFTGNLYGAQITVQFLDFLRGEVRFKSAAELAAQIDCDIRRARQMINSLKPKAEG